MSLFWMNVAKLSRSTGQSAGAHAAYIIRDGRYARARDGQRDRCLMVESQNMPPWAREAEGPNAEQRSAASIRYWDAAYTHLRVNGRQCRKVDFAQPIELNLDQQIALTRRYLTALATLKDGSKLAYTWALHEGGGTNPHVHAMISERVNDGFAPTEATWFKRAAAKGKPAESGGARQTDELDTKDWLLHARQLWAQMANEALEAAGSDARIDHRSNADRGISDLPTEHVGWATGRPRQEALKRNAQRQELNVDLRTLLAERAGLDQLQESGAAAPGDHDHEHDPNRAGRPGRQPGHVDVGENVGISGIPIGAIGADVKQPGDATLRLGAFGQAEPDAGKTPRDATTPRNVVLALPSRSVASPGGERRAGVLHADTHDFLGSPLGTDGPHHDVRRPDPIADGGEPWRLAPQPQGASPGLEGLGAAAGNQLLNAQRGFAAMGQQFAEQMQGLINRLEAVKAAQTAHPSAGAHAPTGAPRLSAVQRLAALIRRPAPPSVAPTPQQPAPDMRLSAISDMAPDQLREQLQITDAAVREAMRVMATGAGGPTAVDAAAGRFGTLNARLKALRAAVAALDALSAAEPPVVPVTPAAPAPVAPAPDPQAELETAWRKAHQVAQRATSFRVLREAVAAAWTNLDNAKALQADAAKPAAWWWPGARERADAARQAADTARRAADAGLRAAIAAAKRGGVTEAGDRRRNRIALAKALAYEQRCATESAALGKQVATQRTAAVAAARDAEAAATAAAAVALKTVLPRIEQDQKIRAQQRAAAEQLRKVDAQDEAGPARPRDQLDVPGRRRR